MESKKIIKTLIRGGGVINEILDFAGFYQDCSRIVRSNPLYEVGKLG